MRHVSRVSALIFLGGILSCAIAQQDLAELSLEELMNISVFSVSKTEKLFLEHSVTTAVITHEQILEYGYTDILDVLRDLPGIHIVDLSISEHAGSEVFVRGIDANTKMLFLMDGEEVGPPTGEPFTLLRNVPLIAVKQVEVSYGAASSLYGADAMAGIVNIVTFTGEDDTADPTAVWLGAASYDTYHGQLRHKSTFWNDVTFSLDGGAYLSEQEDLPDSYPDIFGGFEVDPRVESHSVHARVETRGVALSYLRMAGDRNNGLGFLPSLYDNSGESEWKIVNQFGSLGWDREWSPAWTTHSVISFSQNELDSSSTYSTDFTGAQNYEAHYFYWRGRSTRLAQDLLLKRGILNWLTGVEGEWFESIPKTDIDNPLGSYDVEYRNLGAFTQVELVAAEHLEFTAGIRYDYDSRFDGEWNPRIGFFWKPRKSLRTHANWGTAYLAPAPHKVYERWGQIAEGEYVHLPNPELKPEQTSTFDAGIGWFPTDRSHLILSGFHTRGDDLWRIAFKGPLEVDGVNVVYQTNDNVAESTIMGFDFGGRYELSYGMMVDGHYTYTHGEQDAISLDRKVDLNHVPRHLARISTAWRGEKGHARLVGRWFDRITTSESNTALAGDHIGGAWTVDLFAEHRLLKDPNLWVGLQVHNMLDESYSKVSKFDEFFFSLPTTPQPRRTLGIRARLSF